VLYARVGGVWRKGKVKGQCSATHGEQRVDMKYPDLSRSGTTLFFGIDLSHNYSSSFGNDWLRNIDYRYCWLVLVFYLRRAEEVERIRATFCI
jgi:hypothetical protein